MCLSSQSALATHSQYPSEQQILAAIVFSPTGTEDCEHGVPEIAAPLSIDAMHPQGSLLVRAILL